MTRHQSKETSLHVIGVMSGSSLDGIDIAYTRFNFLHESNGSSLKSWSFEQGLTLPLSEEWGDLLRGLDNGSAHDYALSHVKFGHYLGQLLKQAIEKYQWPIDFIASHGHTIFHDPSAQMTSQIGDGAALSQAVGLPVVCDFRSSDVAAGGQGAPLASLADIVLFAENDMFLNLGGIINMTIQLPNTVLGLDITGCNQVLNALANTVGKPFDHNGRMAATGQVDTMLLAKANALGYLSLPIPKTLSNQWVQNELIPLFLNAQIPLENALRTACEHIALQTARVFEHVLPEFPERAGKFNVLPSGGGVSNSFLLSCIKVQMSKVHGIEMVQPEPWLRDYKEAILMALLGAYRWNHLPNVIPSVTGASRSTINGCIYLA